MRRLERLVVTLVVGLPSLLRGQRADPASQPDGRLLRPGIDSLAIYVVTGKDTTRTGLVVDELRVIHENGRALLQRAYHLSDERLGSPTDMLVDVQASLAPVRRHSIRGSFDVRIDMTELFPDAVLKDLLRPANLDSARVDHARPPTVYSSFSFDLVLRASPLSDTWRASVPVYFPDTRTVVPLLAWVAGTDTVDRDPTWRVAAEFFGVPVSFWVSKTSRALKQKTMQVHPDTLILFASPKSARRPFLRLDRPAAEPSPERRIARMIGCYRMHVGPWTVTGQPRGLVPLAEFRLDSAMVTDPYALAGSRQAFPGVPDYRNRVRPGRWRLMAADSLSVGWGTGFSSGGYLLRIDGDSLHGKATTWSDERTGQPDPTAPAIGVRVPCSA
jgi:hypothetical protein